MQDFEKLGAFYLGKQYDLAARSATDELLLYDAKDLTTHGVCVGMTGSGKTGLCLALLEEAAIDGIPAIAIDPKGDLGNLMLTFPKLRPEDFRPWIDDSEATRNGMSPDDFAVRTAKLWREGLAEWGQDGDRIARFRSSADVAIYTPGSSAGLPLSVLRSLAAPSPSILDDADTFRDRISSATSALLTLLGFTGDPIRSREHILVTNLLDRAWRQGRDVEIASLIRDIQSPPIDKLGFLDLETIFPAQDRFDLSMRLNNLLASPNFAGWMEGEPLSAARLLYTPEGRPRISILSIAHLSESQRMFFVTILLNEILAWMRSQAGTSSLRALLYMDEVFGYFPPTANPPSKMPMLTLLKQARAYGLGIVLATQNPVDLDYKGLSNAGTWFLGRLQTERDKLRVLDGLEGASTMAGSTFDRQRMDAILSGLGTRVFLMNNVHDDAPVVFQSRWALSYLRGPLTRSHIQTLMQPRLQAANYFAAAPAPQARVAPPATAQQDRPLVPPNVAEFFLPWRGSLTETTRLIYRPALLGVGRVHFVHSKSKTDLWENVVLLTPVGEEVPDGTWDAAEVLDGEPDLEKVPDGRAQFASLPPSMMRARNYSSWEKSLKDHLYRKQSLQLWDCVELAQLSEPRESQTDFRIRLRQTMVEQRDLQVEKLRKAYAPKLASLQDQIRRAKERVDREQSQYKQQQFQTAISFGASILGALFGRKLASVTNVGRATTAIRSAGRTAQERGDIGRAEENVETLEQKLADLESQFKAETDKLQSTPGADQVHLEEMHLRPRKSDIAVDKVALVWTPWRIDAHGIAEPAY